MLFVVVLSPLAAVCQGLPDKPQSAPASEAKAAQSPQQLENGSRAKTAASDRYWRKVQRLKVGEPIVVSSTYGPELHGRFAGATEDALFCDAPGSPDGVPYSFERASVLTVLAQRSERNFHPFLIASMVGIGVVAGVRTASMADAASGAGAGVASAAVTGLIGAQVADKQSDSPRWVVVYRSRTRQSGGQSR